MNAKFSLKDRSTIRFVTVLVAVALASAVVRSQAAETASVSTNTYGSGKQFKTIVERLAQGELTAEDLHQASLLTSQLLLHLNEAAQHLADSRSDSARPKIAQAESLAKVVRGLLPATMVTTTVQDAHGKEIYRDVQHVQEDQIPIFERAIALEVVEPIIEAKKDEAALKGVRFADADLIRTSVLVDLAYVERKLKRAAELMDKPKDAAAELVLAQTQGIRFAVNKEDSPLVQTQSALRLAERMVREKKYEGAKANLQLAKLQLEAYRTLAGDAAGKSVADMEKEIQKLSGELQNPGAADKIRGMWDRATAWFKRESGQTRQTGTASSTETKPTQAKEKS